MELLMIIVVVLIVIGNAAKNEQKRAQKARKTARELGQHFNEAFDRVETMTAKAKTQPADPAPAPAQTMQREPLVPQPLVREIAQPQVHTHLAAECEEHDAPGSLGEGSMEGKDLCHEDQLLPVKTPRPTVPVETEETPGLQLDWSGENMVKAFVMQEVLTRPAQRRRHV